MDDVNGGGKIRGGNNWGGRKGWGGRKKSWGGTTWGGIVMGRNVQHPSFT